MGRDRSRADIRDTIINCVRALAAPADLQLGRYPDFVCKADELALDFEEALLFAHQIEITEEHQRALGELGNLSKQ